MSEQQGPPAGWYPHPEMTGTQRYWDGAAWTEHVAPLAQKAPSAGMSNDGLAAAGLITAIFIPIIGFVIGLVLVGRGEQRGFFFAALAMASMVAYYFLISGQFNSGF